MKTVLKNTEYEYETIKELRRKDKKDPQKLDGILFNFINNVIFSPENKDNVKIPLLETLYDSVFKILEKEKGPLKTFNHVKEENNLFNESGMEEYGRMKKDMNVKDMNVNIKIVSDENGELKGELLNWKNIKRIII